MSDTMTPEAALDLSALRSGGNSVIRVKDNSLSTESIVEGDWLVVSPREPRDGDIVVAAVDGRAMVGTLTQMGYMVRIESSEPLVPPRYVPAGAVHGVIVAVVRPLSARV